MATAMSPTPDAVRMVMQSCLVGEAQAKNLLKHSNNDPERAKRRHQTLMIHMKTPTRTPVITPARTPSPANPPIVNPPYTGGSSLKNQSSSEVSPMGPVDDSTDESINITPTTEDGALHQTSPSLSRPRRASEWFQNLNDGRPQTPQVPPRPARKIPHRPSLDSGRNVEQGWQGRSPSDGSTTPMDFQMDNSNPVTSTNTSNATSPSPGLHGGYVPYSPHPEIRVDPPPAHTEPAVEPAEWQTEKSNHIEEPEPPTWNFILPPLPIPANLTPGQGGSSTFNIADLAAAIYHGADEQAVQTYFQYFEPRVITRYINESVAGFPSIFYAVATNNDRILRLWVKHGGDVNAVHSLTQAPLIAFAIMHGETIERDTSEMVATLLSLEASPLAIPTPFYSPYFRDLPEDGPEDEELGEVARETAKWLSKDLRKKVARNMHITHRYNLERAANTPKPSARHWQIAHRKNAEALLGLPFFLIGQSMAAKRLLQTFLSHLAVPSKKPLVLVFAGPSGHGKTELARRLGYLMNLELEVVDCTIVNREMELFGGRHPYMNADQGTPLNNFLARNHQQRSIVFLDEFEKTTKEIHQALLLPFDNGEYQDRRTLKKIDCSQTIWILATNALDHKIKNFCQIHGDVLFNDNDETKHDRLLRDLAKELKETFLAKFDAPVTGRISAFLPFLLFSPGEQAVIAHKYLLELGREVRNPVNLTAGSDERLIGNVRLKVRRDVSVCRHIAEDGYHPELGARSLITAVDSVKTLLIESYLNVDQAISESDSLVNFVIDVNGGELIARMENAGHSDS